MQISFSFIPSTTSSTPVALWVHQRTVDAAVVMRISLDMPQSGVVKSWMRSGALAYFEMRQLGFVCESGKAQGAMCDQPPPPYKPKLRTVIGGWLMQTRVVEPKNSKAPIITFPLIDVLNPIKCFYPLINSSEQTSYFSLIGRAVRALPDEYYPWKWAFEKAGLPKELANLLMSALTKRVKSRPRDVDVRIETPVGRQELQAEAIELLVQTIFQQFALTSQQTQYPKLPDDFPNLEDKVIESECLAFGSERIKSLPLQEQKKLLRIAFIERKYFQSEPLKCVYGADGNLRRMTRILRPDLKINPLGIPRGPLVPLELVVAGQLKCSQLFYGSLAISLDPWVFCTDQPVMFGGKDPWTGLFCIAFENCLLVDKQSIDEQAWCRTVQAYSEGQSCFEAGAESVVVSTLFHSALVRVQKGRAPEAVAMDEVLMLVGKWLTAFFLQHEDNEPAAFASMYYNAVRTLGGSKIGLNIDVNNVVEGTFEAALLKTLGRADIPFMWLNSMLQLTCVLTMSLGMRDRCARVELDTTDGVFAVRIWMGEGEGRRSILLPLDLPQAVEFFTRGWAESPEIALETTWLFFGHLFSESREPTCDMAHFFAALGLTEDLLVPLVNQLSDSPLPLAKYLGMVFGELLQKICPDTARAQSVDIIKQLPRLLAPLSEEQRKALLISFRQRLSGTVYEDFLDGSAFPSELLGEPAEAHAYCIQRLMRLGSERAKIDLSSLVSDTSMDPFQLLQLIEGQDHALSLKLVGRCKKHDAEELWGWIVRIVESLPDPIGLACRIELFAISELWNPVWEMNAHPRALCLLLLHHRDATLGWARLRRLISDGTLSSVNPFVTDTWIGLIGQLIDGGNKEDARQSIKHLLQNLQALQSLGPAQRDKLTTFCTRVGVAPDDLEKIARNCILSNKSCRLGYALYDVLYVWDGGRPRALELLTRIPQVFSSMALGERAVFWVQLRAQYGSDFDPIFDSVHIPAEFLKPSIALDWAKLLMLSGRRELVRAGKELWQAQQMDDSMKQIAQNVLPEMVKTSFSAAVEVVLKLNQHLVGKTLLDAVLVVARARSLSSGLQDQGSFSKLSSVVPKVVELADEKNSADILWLIDQENDLQRRMAYLKCMRTKCPEALFVSAWLSLIVQCPDPWMVFLQARAAGVSFRALKQAEQVQLAERAAAVAPPCLEALLELIEAYPLDQLVHSLQHTLVLHTQKLSVDGLRKNWKRISPYLLEESLFTLLPRYIDVLTISPKGLVKWLRKFIALRLPKEHESIRIRQAVSLLCSHESLLTPNQVGEMVLRLGSFRDADAMGPDLLGLFKKYINHVPRSEEVVWFIQQEPCKSTQLELLTAAYEFEKISVDNIDGFTLFLTLAEELQQTCPEAVWEAVLQVLHGKIPSNALVRFQKCVEAVLPKLVTRAQLSKMVMLYQLFKDNDLCYQISSLIYDCLKAEENLVFVHHEFEYCYSCLTELQIRCLLPALISSLLAAKQPVEAIKWWQRWILLDWTDQETMQSLPLAEQLIADALAKDDTDAALQLVAHEKVRKGISPQSFLDILRLEANRIGSAKINQLLKEIFTRKFYSDELLEIFQIIKPRVTYATMQSSFEDHVEHIAAKMIEAYCLLHATTLEDNVCKSIFEVYGQHEWCRHLFSRVLKQLIHSHSFISAAQFMLLPSAKIFSIDENDLQDCVQGVFHDPQLMVKLLQMRSCRLLSVWHSVWNGLMPAKDGELIDKAYEAFLEAHYAGWSDHDEGGLFETWQAFITTVNGALIDELERLTGLLLELEQQQGSSEIMHRLWSHLFCSYLANAEATGKPQIVHNALIWFKKARKSSQTIKDPVTSCTIVAEIVKVSFAVDVPSFSLAEYCYKQFKTIPGSLLPIYSSMLAAMADATVLLPLENVESLLYRAKPERPEDCASFIKLLARYNDIGASELAYGVIIGYHQQNGLVTNEMLRDISNAAHLLPWEKTIRLRSICDEDQALVLISLLTRYNTSEAIDLAFTILFERLKVEAVLADSQAVETLARAPIRPAFERVKEVYHLIIPANNEVKFALMRLLIRYDEQEAIIFASRLLRTALETSEPIVADLCVVICDMLECSTDIQRDYPEYNAILRSPRTLEFMEESLRYHLFVANTLRRFKAAMEQKNQVLLASLVDWGFEHLKDYLGPHNKELTRQFVLLILESQQIDVIYHLCQEFMPGVVRTTSIYDSLKKLFTAVQKNHPHCVSILVEKPTELSEKCDLALAIEVVEALTHYPSSSYRARTLFWDIAAQFLTVLAKVPSRILSSHLSALRLPVAKCIIAQSIDPNDEGGVSHAKAIALWNQWERYLGDQAVVVAMAVLDSLPGKYQSYAMVSLINAVNYLMSSGSRIGFVRAINLVGHQLIYMFQTKDPHGRLKPFVESFLKFAEVYPEHTVELNGRPLTSSGWVFAFLSTYEQLCEGLVSPYEKGIPLLAGYLETLVLNLVNNMSKMGKLAFDKPASQNQYLHRAGSMLLNCSVVLNGALKREWHPKVIKSFLPLAEKILSEVIPLLPLVIFAHLDKDYQEYCSGIIELLTAAEKDRVYQALDEAVQLKLEATYHEAAAVFFKKCIKKDLT